MGVACPRTSSSCPRGPPLEVLMASLQKLRDLRTAAPRDDIRSRYRDLERIRAALGVSA